jgi:DNA-binding NarL/FixJ family response regulator
VSWNAPWSGEGRSFKLSRVGDADDVEERATLVLRGYEAARQLVSLLERVQESTASPEELAILRDVVRLFDPGGSALTEAEWAVVQLAGTGLTNAAIAERRGTTARTVSKQLDSAYRKLGVSSRRELAVRLARR